MGSFFNMDGPFYKFGNILADMMLVGLLWIVCCIPIVTIGASTTSMFYIMTRKQSDRDGYLMRDFFTSFKKNFKLATLTWLTFLVAGIILFVNITIARKNGGVLTYISPLYYVMMLELILISLYLYPILSRFELGYKELFKTSFFMANKHILTTISCVALYFGSVYLIFVMPPAILIVGGVYSYLTSILFIKVFRKYRPELDVEIIDNYGRSVFSDLSNSDLENNQNEINSSEKELNIK